MNLESEKIINKACDDIFSFYDMALNKARNTSKFNEALKNNDKDKLRHFRAIDLHYGYGLAMSYAYHSKIRNDDLMEIIIEFFSYYQPGSDNKIWNHLHEVCSQKDPASKKVFKLAWGDMKEFVDGDISKSSLKTVAKLYESNSLSWDLTFGNFFKMLLD